MQGFLSVVLRNPFPVSFGDRSRPCAPGGNRRAPPLDVGEIGSGELIRTLPPNGKQRYIVVDERLSLHEPEDHGMDVVVWLQDLGLERIRPT